MVFDNNPPAAVALGIIPFPTVRAAASVNVSLTVPPSQVDGVVLGPAADRVLLTAQTNPAENGLYELTAGGAESGYSFDAGDPPQTHAALAGRLYRVTCTGGCVVVGANGVVAGPTATGGFGGLPSVGFLDPGEDGLFSMSTSVGQAGTVAILATTTLVRIAEANQAAEFVAGRPVLVEEGIGNGGTWWNRNQPITLGTDHLTFDHKVASGVALDQFPAGIANAPDSIPWTPPGDNPS